MAEKKINFKSKYVKMSLAIFCAGLGLLLCYYILYNTNDVRNI